LAIPKISSFDVEVIEQNSEITTKKIIECWYTTKLLQEPLEKKNYTKVDKKYISRYTIEISKEALIDLSKIKNRVRKTDI
jgi:hypothetical protein